jgi:hypothetical protein
MNLLLLPKELQDLIGEFNVEHRFKTRVVLNQLLEKHNNRIIIDSVCINCGDCTDENYTMYIYWCKYTYCGEWCQNDGATMFKNYRKSLRKLNK